MKRLTIKSKLGDYQVHFVKDPKFLQKISETQNSFFVIDENVWKLYGNKILRPIKKRPYFILPIHENKKTLKTVEDLYLQAVDLPFRKNLSVVSIGGGITQDVTGFFASTIYRGVAWIYIPTTLLSQTDSCIGAKTSLNFHKYKNLVGTFYPPRDIYIYPEFIDTLDELNYYSGLGEMVKLFIIGGENYIQKLEQITPKLLRKDKKVLLNGIYTALKIKKEYIEVDEFDCGIRNILNFGHTFGHALESATNFAVYHGQAVLLGMIFANLLSNKRGLLSIKKTEYLNNLIRKFIIINLKEIKLNKLELINAMKKDKKKTGEKFSIIITNNDYQMVKINDISESEILTNAVNFIAKI